MLLANVIMLVTFVAACFEMRRDVIRPCLFQLRYKTRVYNYAVESAAESRRIAKMQGEGKRKELMRYVRQHNTDKMIRILTKGLDPNFHTPPNGGKCGDCCFVVVFTPPFSGDADTARNYCILA